MAGTAAAGRAPVIESGPKSEPVSEAVGDGEAARALELRQHNYHLPEKVWKRTVIKEKSQMLELLPPTGSYNYQLNCRQSF